MAWVFLVSFFLLFSSFALELDYSMDHISEPFLMQASLSWMICRQKSSLLFGSSWLVVVWHLSILDERRWWCLRLYCVILDLLFTFGNWHVRLKAMCSQSLLNLDFARLAACCSLRLRISWSTSDELKAYVAVHSACWHASDADAQPFFGHQEQSRWLNAMEKARASWLTCAVLDFSAWIVFEFCSYFA